MRRILSDIVDGYRVELLLGNGRARWSCNCETFKLLLMRRQSPEPMCHHIKRSLARQERARAGRSDGVVVPFPKK